MVIGISITYEMLENHERKWGKKLNLGADIPISHVNPFSKKPVDDVPGDYSPKQKKLAAVAKPRNKITGADLKKLRKKKT